ncbi:triose-phosphate isomerase [Oceaniserpentilla sp. 4NH20-0058]|uniref:triose-phosphate isomerase n=1 Tax=Oceaniserpentilla sp. 4NH20-0058 TaxID=3127660 RepID=UPI00310C6D2B
MRRKIVAGNWKMHGTLAENEARLSQLVLELKSRDACDVAVFPSAPYLFQCQNLLANSIVMWGAQNVSQHPSGAYTGEISTAMLADFGCQYALIGHSERRELFHETDQDTAQKFAVVLEAGLKPMLCVGETLDQRESGDTMVVINRQIDAVLASVGIAGFTNAVIAYEPVWAIGTGKTATPEQAQEVHGAIRQQLAQHDAVIAESLQILYGGSVKPDNAEAIFAQPDVDGALVGGASLNPTDFIKICNAAG